MRIYTCTPVPFRGDHTFFSRDSGLCCRGLQSIGVESCAIMPTPGQVGDDPDLIRTPYANLESAEWWLSLEIDGVVFYSWGMGQYTPIARAIKRAGLPLLVNMDTGGLLSPYVDITGFWYSVYSLGVARHGRLVGPLIAMAKTLRAALPWVQDIPRIKHLDLADAIGAISPIAAKRIAKFIKIYRGELLSAKVHLLPHPVAQYFRYDKSGKDQLILCVGRWDSLQKNVVLAVNTIIYCLNKFPTYEAIFIGSGANEVRKLFANHAAVNNRVRIYESLLNKELLSYYLKSQISLCASYYESGHIVSEEALCCGCSIVAPASPTLPSMPYYIAHGSGQLGGVDALTLGEAMCREIGEWQAGNRNAAAISDYWCRQLHADAIATRIIKVLGFGTQ